MQKVSERFDIKEIIPINNYFFMFKCEVDLFTLHQVILNCKGNEHRRIFHV